MSTPPDRPQRAQPMVGWFDPGQLMKTGVEVLVSSLFGRHSDHRLIEAMTDSDGAPFLDYTQHYKEKEDKSGIEHDTARGERQEMWVDYVADTGDGWDSTYAVALAIAHTHRCEQVGTRPIPRTRGQLLVMGGDQVYPTASRTNYKERLTAPYAAALESTTGEHPHVLAIPGNHDWYDSLVSFTRMFISKSWLGGWLAPQHRSYFACKLPGGWWLLGVDTQLGSDIDGPQMDYFKKAAAEMVDGDRVILCCAEPQWIYERFYKKMDRQMYSESNLYQLNTRVLKGRVRVFVAGDLHHYRRHANEAGIQKITAGGGGAFLHPTHKPNAEYLLGDPEKEKERSMDKEGNSEYQVPDPEHSEQPYEQKASFPDADTSARLAWRNLLFPFLNPRFGTFTAVLYFITAWAFMLPLPSMHFADGHAYLAALGTALGERPAAGFWALLVVVLVAFFTDTHNMWYRVIAGTLHGCMHLAAILFLGWIAAVVADGVLAEPPHAVALFAVKTAVILLGGWLLGALILGLYLLVSINGFGRHNTEAFSALKIPHYKCFLRFHVDTSRKLTIHPMGITRVPRKWKKEPQGSSPAWTPTDRKLQVHLIEDPIEIG